MPSPEHPPTADQPDIDDHDDFGGLRRDVASLLGRRRALTLLGGAGLAAGVLAACGSDGSSAGSGSSSTTAASGSGAPSTTSLTSDLAASGAEIPDETPGPFPADGTNGPNVLADSGIVRTDITTSFGSSSGTATGTPITFQLSVVDASSGSPMPGAAVYLWHCTADGRYSIYEIEDQNFLRGVGVADDAGRVTFDSVFPGCYPGRWPHAHFEVFASLDAATNGAAAVKTSQLALPEADCRTAYADDAYGSSDASLDRLSLETDGVFRDGWSDQLATVSGSTVSLLVRV